MHRQKTSKMSAKGAQMGPQWAPMGSKMPPKIIKNRPLEPKVAPGTPPGTQKYEFSSILTSFWEGFGDRFVTKMSENR